MTGPLPYLVEDATFWPLLTRLSESLTAELAAEGGPGFCYQGLIPGDIMPLDLMNCDTGDCSVSWVRAASAYPSLRFPTQAEYVQCTAPLAMQVEIGVARCYPQARGRDGIDPQAMFNTVRLYMADVSAMRRALVNTMQLPEVADMYDMAMGNWTPIEAQGGKSGGTWTVTVGRSA